MDLSFHSSFEDAGICCWYYVEDLCWNENHFVDYNYLELEHPGLNSNHLMESAF